MLIKDIQAKLNRICLVSIEQDGFIFDLTRRYNLSLPSFLYGDEERIMIDVFATENQLKGVEKELEGSDKFEKKYGMRVYTTRVNHLEKMKIIDEIFSTISVISNSRYVSDGKLFFQFRFHDSTASKISEILSRFMERDPGTDIEYLGPSSGIISTINSLNSMIPLHVIKYSIPFNKQTSLGAEIVDKYGLIAEMENHRMKNNHFQALIYSMRDLPKNEISGLEVISFDDRIFSVPIYVDILSEIRKRANDEKIPRFSMFVRKRKDKIEVTSIVPSPASKEYVKILLELSKSRRDGSIDLDAYIKYEESIWDWA